MNQTAKLIDEAFVDSDGWLHSGDRGHFDEDGFLYVMDRLVEILKYLDHQISPSEMEAAILKHPDVTAVCVVGIPDALFTDLPAAVVLQNRTGDVTGQDIIESVKSMRQNVFFVDVKRIFNGDFKFCRFNARL